MKYVTLRAEGIRHLVEVLLVRELDEDRHIIHVRAYEHLHKGVSFTMTEGNHVIVECVVSSVAPDHGAFLVELRALKSPFFPNLSPEEAARE